MADRTCAGCALPPTVMWQRYATETELESFRQSGDIGPGETSALVPVFACDDHMLSDELMANYHDADCEAPPSCTCALGQGGR